MRRPCSLLACAVLVGGAAFAQSPANSDSAPTAPGHSLIITDIRTGTGPALTTGQTAVVQYTGWIYAPGAADHKGSKFDSSRDHGAPFSFFVGGGEVIAGWDRGVVGMRAGGLRQLIVPAALGYGARGAGNDIPPNATLLFEIELIAIR
ncbi:MAG TPA: FKBP-type peptidyl-prolyl cis-trans isomerase [Steroidobacteraceae bacterium]